MAYRDLVEGLHERLRERGWQDVRPVFGFVLLAARDQPITTTEVAELIGATKQAASKLAGVMIEAGYLAQGESSSDGRQRPLRLTPRGHRLLAAVEAIYEELEADWAEHIGATAVDRLRRDLTRAVTAAHDGKLPPVRPTW
jgi:DNA-binding MarR family transcriptional regulator